jgi:hypothetical protein
MESLISAIIYTHVLAGVISLIVVLIAMSVRKGGTQHILWGRTFFWCMTWIFLTAIFLSVYKWIPFLLMIAVLSYYSVVIGYRSVFQKRLHAGEGVKWYDWVALMVAGIFNLGFVAYGIYLATTKGLGALSFLSMAFGAGGCSQVIGQLKSFLSPPNDKMGWLYSHAGNMMGGYIASVTAFSTQVLYFLPVVLQWTWPSLIGIPLIAILLRSYRRKFMRGAPVSQLVKLR